MTSIILYSLLSFTGVVVLHFITLLIGLPEVLRPLTWVGWLGDAAVHIYEWVGTVVGYAWYCGMVAAAWFRDVIVERFGPALKQTVVDAFSVVEKFLSVSVFFEAIKTQVYDFWNTYYSQIVQGTIAAIVLGVCVVVVYTIFWRQRAVQVKVPVGVVEEEHIQKARKKYK
jgi:hypothetical protein